MALNQTVLGLSIEDLVDVWGFLNDSNPNNLWTTLRNISIGAQVAMVTIMYIFYEWLNQKCMYIPSPPPPCRLFVTV